MQFRDADEARAYCADLHEQIEALEKANEALREDLANAEDEIEGLKAEIYSLDAELADLRI